jgi:hypothetical protein
MAAPARCTPASAMAAASAAQAGQNGAARSPQIAALASMLRGTPRRLHRRKRPPPRAAQTGDPFGTWGNLNSMIGTTKPDTSKLPPEIAAQLQDEVRVDEGGAQSHNYNFNENPWGGFKDSDGKYWVQVGDPNSNKAGDGGIKDKSKVVYKPGAGYVTTPDNLNDYGGGGIDWRMVLAVVGAGLAGGAAGLGADAAGGAAGGAGEAAAGSGLAPLQGVTLAPETSIGTMGTYGGAGEAAGGLGPMAEMGGPSAGAGVPVTDLSVQAQQPSILKTCCRTRRTAAACSATATEPRRASVASSRDCYRAKVNKGAGDERPISESAAAGSQCCRAAGRILDPAHAGARSGDANAEAGSRRAHESIERQSDAGRLQAIG